MLYVCVRGVMNVVFSVCIVCCHVILNQNYLQLFVLMLTDVSYGILNQEKCTIFMSLGEK